MLIKDRLLPAKKEAEKKFICIKGVFPNKYSVVYWGIKPEHCLEKFPNYFENFCNKVSILCSQLKLLS